MANPTEKEQRQPNQPKSGRPGVFEVIGYMAAGAYAYQMGVWMYRTLRRPEPVREGFTLPAIEVPVVLAPPAPPARPPRRSPPPAKKKPSDPDRDIDDRFSMLEIEK